MNTIETYLFFNGNCAEAMRFYERTLGGTLKMLQSKEAPDGGAMYAGGGDLIMHSRLDAPGAVLMASDWLAPDPYPGMSGFSVALYVPDAKEAKRLFDALVDGGQVSMPFQKTFFSEGFGMLVDRFGTPWMVMTESADTSDTSK